MEKQPLKIGTNINISRSNGNVHLAMVTKIDYNSKSVLVEWSDAEDTYAKEINFGAICLLNANIDTDESKENNRQAEPTSSSSSSSLDIPVPVAGSSLNANLALKRHTGILSKPFTVRSTVRTSNITANVSRQSSVVKEVEMLKKNREQRRQKQLEGKVEKEAFRSMGISRPHWKLENMILDYRRNCYMNPLSDNDIIENHLITVCVRKRPLNSKEALRKEADIITMPTKNQLIVHEPKTKVDLTKYLENHLFRFDYTFNENCCNAIVYKYSAQPLVKTIFEGAFSTCFAYGQTGSGKTHTMGGILMDGNYNYNNGIYAMAATDVFKLINSPQYKRRNFVVSASFFEIYSEKVFDLLDNKNKLKILEDGNFQVQVVGLTEKVVTSVDEVLKLIQRGTIARTAGTTSANLNSSRSHAIFQIILRLNNSIQKIHGKFSLIDLAGNERGADTSSSNRQTRMEGAEINKSLLALKECIRALGRNGSHLPFRSSKLTHVLRDSFIGENSKTCMIAMISPSITSCEHTLNTLRYADRVKELGGGDVPSGVKECDAIQPIRINNVNNTIQDDHASVELQVAKRNLQDSHKNIIHIMKEFETDSTQLLLDNHAYNHQEYHQILLRLFANAKNDLITAFEIAEDFNKNCIKREESSS